MEDSLSLTEIIFTGTVSKIDFSFLKDLLSNSGHTRLNYLETEVQDYSSITDLIRSREYVDVAFDSSKLHSIPNVFVNLVLDSEEVELLFFLDLEDVNYNSIKESLDWLIDWAARFRNSYKFDVVVCQPDNAEAEEFYFKNGEYGPFYSRLS